MINSKEIKELDDVIWEQYNTPFYMVLKKLRLKRKFSKLHRRLVGDLL